MKKKTYIAPELNIHLIQLERMVALSQFDAEAKEDGLVLSKGSGDWNIWDEGSDSDYDDEIDY